jgi:hypothetical protein
MSKIYYSIILFSLCADSSYLQIAAHSSPKYEKFTIGLRIGLNYANFNANSSFPAFGPYNEAKLGFMAGGVLEYNFRGNISAQTGILYVNAGAKTREFTGTDVFGNEVGKFHFVQELKFLEFPILVNYNIPVSKLKLCFSAGSNIGLLLSAKEKFESNYQSDIRHSMNIKDSMKSINVMFEIGGGAVYSIGFSYALEVEIKYGRGLTNQIIEYRTASSQKSKDLRLISTVSYNL